jgi:hypothetical protein
MKSSLKVRVLFGIIVFCVFALLIPHWCLGLNSVGMYYDEALFYQGAIAMLHPKLPHPLPASHLVSLLGRDWPLMTMPYAGAIKSYLALPVFWLFGTSVTTARIVSLLIGFFGILAWGELLNRWMGPRFGVSAFLLWMWPSMLYMILWDFSVAPAIFCLGISCGATARYLVQPSRWSAFFIGLGLGLALWTRFNLAWLLAAAIISLFVFFRTSWLPPAPTQVSVVSGALLGFAPAITYLLRSGDEVWRTLQSISLTATWEQLIRYRLFLLADSLWMDGTHRKIISFPSLAGYWLALIGFVALVVVIVCLQHFRTHRPAAALALTAVLYCAFMLPSRAPIAEHHFIFALPLLIGCLLSVLDWAHPSGVKNAWVLLVAGTSVHIYFAQTILNQKLNPLWNHDTTELAQFLNEKQFQGTVGVADWGIATQIYVLTEGRVLCHEEYVSTESEWQQAKGRYPLWIAPSIETATVNRTGLKLVHEARRQQPSYLFGRLRLLSTDPSTAKLFRP